MDETPQFFEDPEGTQEALIRATYHALCEHGYADLTIQRIGNHFEKSTSLIYHHYDSKDELLLDFLAYMLREFEETVPEETSTGAVERLETILDGMIAEMNPAGHASFIRAMAELRAQGANDDRYRDHFTRHDRFFRERLAEMIRTGIDDGVFREVSPERTAALLTTVITGSLTLQATTDDPQAEAVREGVRALVDQSLLREPSS